MGSTTNLVSSIFDSLNAASNVIDDAATTQAQYSTQVKQVQLKQDVNDLMDNIRRNGDSTQWQSDATKFFESVKSGMNDKNSPYYCSNMKQANMFQSILDSAKLSVDDKLSTMVFNADRDKALVEYNNSLALLKNQVAGNDYVNQANELARGLKNAGYIDDSQYQQLLDGNTETAYKTAITMGFEQSVDDAIKNGTGKELLFEDVAKNADDIMGVDINGLPKTFDKDVWMEAAKKVCFAKYDAKLSDMQQKNANTLSTVVQSMRQENTAEGKVQQALRGQAIMNQMGGLKLSENDRLQYSAIFELALGGDTLKGGKSGSGSSAKPSDSFEKLIQTAPDTALQLWIDGKNGNMYDVTDTMAYALKEQWYTGIYKENYDKDAAERDESYNLLYKGKTSSESLTDAVMGKLSEKFPTAKNYIDKNFDALVKDINKHPEQYGDATVGELSRFIFDWLGESTSNMTDDDFVKAFTQHVNDCYVERIKYVELKNNGKLAKTFDAKKPADIAEAAKLVHEKDFVFTYNGEENWATGKKEALEAKGGIVDVMKNAVAGTLDIPESEEGKIGHYYKQTRDDMQSVPIITYGNKAYEVNATDDGKNFTLTEIHTGEVIQGKSGAAKAKEARAEQKSEAKTAVKDAHDATRETNERRIEDTNTKISETKAMPAAMKAAGKVKDIEWETGKETDRQIYLQDTESAINKAAKKVKDNKMSPAKFTETYGIKYSDWIETSEKTKRFNLILNSK